MPSLPNSVSIPLVVRAARQAGAAIMAHYGQPTEGLTTKADQSPLTLADQAGHNVIAQALAELTPGLPVLSEEGRDIPYEERKNWGTFWLVDPLDGTKEFIKQNDDFTVNIALIQERTPVLGVIFAPALKTMYWGDVTTGEAYRQIGEAEPTLLRTSEHLPKPLRGVGSRSHSKVEEQILLQQLGVDELTPRGSSLKFCAVAEGQAEVYFRYGLTAEWDIAAGHAILLAAGGKFLTPNGPFLYNKRDVLNPPFLCLAAGMPSEEARAALTSLPPR